MFPTSLQGFAGPLASQLPITPFNLVCTNVPGPQFPLYLLGHKMLQWYPYVPVGGEMAVNCAILSYDGKVYFGFSGDVHAAPDLRRMEKLLLTSFQELRDAVALRNPEKKRVRKQRRAVPAATEEAKVVVADAPVASVASPMPMEVKRAPQPATMTERTVTEQKSPLAQFVVA
jgi:hypothetical protein